MYYLAKFTQAAGLTIILIGFLIKFPSLMDFRVFGIGIMFFLFGWIIQWLIIKK